jgi:hypothetical protein
MSTSSVNTPVITQAPNNITELPVRVQGRIFSYLSPREQGAVYTTNHRGHDSLCNDYPMSRQGWTPENAIPQLPPSLLLQISEYLPQDARMCMKQTSYTMCNLLSRYEVKCLQQNPMISWMIPTTPSIDQRTDCRQILSDLALVIHLPSREELDSLNDLRSSMDKLPLDNILTSEPSDYNQLVCALHVINSDVLVKPNMEYRLFAKKTYDFLTGFYLTKGNREEFYTYLPKSSFPSGNSYHDMTELFFIAAEKNHEDIFINLLLNYKLSSANRLLKELTEKPEIPSKYIEHLLRSDQPIDSDYDIFSLSGILEALFYTAAQKNMSAFKAILAARPGEAIDRRILEDIRHRFVPDFPFPLLDYIQRLIHTNYPDEASRQEMIALIDTEIQTRYPPKTREVILEALKELPLEENSSDDDAEPVAPDADFPEVGDARPVAPNADFPEVGDAEPVAPNADFPEAGDAERVAPNADFSEAGDVEPEDENTIWPMRSPSDADISCSLL